MIPIEESMNFVAFYQSIPEATNKEISENEESDEDPDSSEKEESDVTTNQETNE